jgi:hypothetical protein
MSDDTGCSAVTQSKSKISCGNDRYDYYRKASAAAIRTTMPDANDALPKKNDSAQSDDDADSTVQSLTDFFDQMDRASFKRMLDSRDARRENLRPAKSDRR